MSVHNQEKYFNAVTVHYTNWNNWDTKKDVRAAHDKEKYIQCNQSDYAASPNGHCKTHVKAPHIQ